MHDDCTPSANLISHRHSAYDIQSSLQLFSIFTRTTLILPSCTLSLTFLCPVSYFHVPYFLSSCTLPLILHVGLTPPVSYLWPSCILSCTLSITFMHFSSDLPALFLWPCHFVLFYHVYRTLSFVFVPNSYLPLHNLHSKFLTLLCRPQNKSYLAMPSPFSIQSIP